MELSNPPEHPEHSENNPGARQVADNSDAGDGIGATLTDARAPGEFASRYPGTAWCQIGIEFAVLLIYMLVTSAALLAIGFQVAQPSPADNGTLLEYFEYPRDRIFLIWLSLALSGVVGGTAFALKWLYHSVATLSWNRDRLLWRLIVPPLSGVVAIFLAFMVASGIVPFLNSRAFDNFYMALGSGFFFGYFSDNVLAALQRLAIRTFGTVNR